MGFLRHLALLCALLAVCCTARAQDPYYRSINKSSGLPSNSVYDIFQDRKGFIWVTTDAGLSRYDGFEFRTYTSSRQTSRPGNAIKQDKYGRIWYKNFDGYLYYVENDTLRALQQNVTVGNAEYALIGDTLMVVQRNGLDLYRISDLQRIGTIAMDMNVHVAEMDDGKHFYIASGDSIYRMSPSGSRTALFTGMSGRMTTSRQGITILEGNGKWLKYDDNGNVKQEFDISKAGYFHGSAYCGGIYWLFTPRGVWLYDEDAHSLNNGSAFYSSMRVSAVTRDREGNYWLGTLDDGILLVPDLSVKLIGPQGFAPTALSIYGNTIYAGTRDNAIFSYDIATHSMQKRYQDTLKHEVRRIVHDSINNSFYIFSNFFLQADKDFKVRRRYTYSAKDGVIVDAKYLGYASSGACGLVRMRTDIKSEWDTLFDSSVSPVDKEVCNIIKAIRGKAVAYNPATHTLYTGSSNMGTFRITPTVSQEIQFNGRHLYTHKLLCWGSKVYALTPENTLYVIDQHNNIAPALKDATREQVLNIKQAGNNLYLLTSGGIRALDTLTGRFSRIQLHPGIKCDEINDLAIAGERMIIASDRGLLVLDRSRKDSSASVPGFVVNYVEVNGLKTDSARLCCLPHTENDVDINYSMLSFSSVQNFHIYYQINDGKWQPASDNTRDLKLAALSPGSYAINFRLTDDSGNNYPQGSVSFTIRKPFWLMWWFLGGCALLLSASGYAYYKWQTSLLKKQNLLVVEKMELEKNLRTSMLTSIKAQMNPHFFYNALNSIQSFIFSDDKRNASSYLVKLSRLTRLILEMSEKESVTLDEEIEALQLYLDLEKMRFDTSFHYDVTIASNVDTELVKIPPMIVQPYVENAIKHGLLHKKDDKRLHIEFARNNGTLCITIDDNGIGREKAGQLKQVKREQHNPFSTHANSRRIELLNKERSKNIGVVYIDKTDDHGNAAGTTVIISIPLI